MLLCVLSMIELLQNVQLCASVDKFTYTRYSKANVYKLYKNLGNAFDKSAFIESRNDTTNNNRTSLHTLNGNVTEAHEREFGPAARYDVPRASRVKSNSIPRRTSSSDRNNYVYPQSVQWIKNPPRNVTRVTSFSRNRGNNKIGFYNIQTGDEFYMSHFDIRPKFRTRRNDSVHVMGYTYHPVPGSNVKSQVNVCFKRFRDLDDLCFQVVLSIMQFFNPVQF